MELIPLVQLILVASNWCSGVVPTSAVDVIITSVPNLPVLSSNVSVNNISIASGAMVTLSGKTLTINGAYSGTGSLTGDSLAGLVLNGAAGTVNFTTNTSDTRNNYLKTLTLGSSATATLGDSLNIAAGTFASPGTVTLNGGTLHAGNVLTLKSNVNGDASVAQSTGTISDSVVVERYIPAKRAWRFVNTPFSSSSQTINKAWQEGASNPDIYTHYNPHPGFGTEITYDNLTAHGFDVNTTANPSLLTWVQSTGSWSSGAPYTNSTSITGYPAYFLFIRGSRAVDLSMATSAPADPTVLRAKGLLNETGLDISSSFTAVTGDYLFVGNPYASPVNILSTLSHSTGVYQNIFYVWDPTASGSYGVGDYVSYSNGVFAPTGGGYAGSTYVQSGQSFFAQANATGTSTLTFKQSDKYTTEAKVFGGIEQPPAPPAVVYANLMLPSGDSLILLDGVAAAFGKGYSAGVDGMDAQKQWNVNENIALVRNGSWLAIEFRPVPVLTDTLFYTMYLNQQPYALKIFMKDVPAGFPQAWLVDKYLKTTTAFNTAEPLVYNFTPNSDTNSSRNRFMLVFKRTLKATPVATTMSSGGAQAATLEGKVDVFPNPVVTGSKALLKFSSMKAGKYEVSVSSFEGKTLTKMSVQHEGGDYSYSLQLDAGWATGNYLVTIKGENGYATTVNLVIGK